MNGRSLYQAISCLVVLTAMSGMCLQQASADDAYTPFDGEKSSWHDGFDRLDYLMDDDTLDIQPFKRDEGERFGIKDPPAGKHRCVVIVPRQPALGNPWSWRSCYWDHQPQTEVELLRRGFHVAYISANATLRPGKQWDAWYAFLTDKHGLSRKPSFIGMSRGGEYSYTWATANPGKVSCIYVDNPGINAEILGKLGELARADVPILHVCGSIDPLLMRSSTTIESIYQQFGGRISVMIKEGASHHPHSLRDPGPIADFISQSIQPVLITQPTYMAGRVSRTSLHSHENSYRYFPKESNYITCRGPWFTECYDRYSFTIGGVEGAITVIVPKKPAPGKPWVFRADLVGSDSAVDLALLANGFHIVTGPVPYNGDGPSLQHWNATYKLLADNGFSRRPVLSGAGGAAGEAYAWAIANPDKVSCVYGENPVLHCTMTKAQPLENLDPLAKAGVRLLHVCGALDPMFEGQTREAERRYQRLGGNLAVIVQPGEGHYPTGPKDPKAVVDFILRQQERKPTVSSAESTGTESKAITTRRPDGASRTAGGRYLKVDYPASTVQGELQIPVTYALWIPDGVERLRGLIVHQHGAGTTASIEGSTAAYDLHWQALARKWDCALLGPSYHVRHEQNDLSPGGPELWFDPRRGSEKAFLKALGDLGRESNHREMERIPWVLWGHSGGGIWADVLSTMHPERVVAIWMRSGSAAQFRSHSEFVRPQVPEACYAIPIMLNPGVKEENKFKQNPKGLERGPWWGNLATFREYRERGALIGFAPDPRTDHECGDSRYLAIPYLDACMALRFPEKGSLDQTLKRIEGKQSWLATLRGEAATPASEFRGNIKESVWLPNEAVAKAWSEYVKTGAVGDSTPPRAPFNVTVSLEGSRGAEIIWAAEADFESGIGAFRVLRDGEEVAKIPRSPIGKFGRPLFQGMTYHDTPTQPLSEMRYLDTSTNLGEEHVYTVKAINGVGLESAPSPKSTTAKK
jgi:pimeloyl-ACP methyl ester carboxylesterase